MKTKVALIACDSYDEKDVEAAVKRGIDLIGGIDKFVKKDERILLKPNFLTAKEPEACVTTHPSVFNGAVKVLKEAEFDNLYYGDSPGFGKGKVAAKLTGFEKIAEKNGVIRAEFDHGETVKYPDGRVIKSFEIAEGALNADAIISLSKMKTHAMTRITGAIKNQFGLVYGMNKAAFHSKFPNLFDFSKALIDLNTLYKPRLFIMDGIMAMEGNGPKNGTPKKMGVILVSEDGYALDTVFAHLVGLDPMYVPTLKMARELGIGETELKNIEVVGDDLESHVDLDFKVERIPVKEEDTGFGFMQYVRNFITRRPVVDRKKCISCGVCLEHCPQEPKAIKMLGDPKHPVYNYNRCIRCFCCQELCPNDAISVKTPLLGKLLLYK